MQSDEAVQPPNGDAAAQLPKSSVKGAPSFFVSSSPFSIYQEMCRVLSEDGWRMEKRAERMTHCQAILGDRFDIPYHILRTCQVVPGRPKVWVNYFKGSHKLTLKAPMGELLTKYEPESSQWMPMTFSLCSQPKRGVRDEREQLQSNFVVGGPIWIVKPSSGCHGNGMLVTDSFSALCEFVDASPTTLFVAQHYIDRPLLVRGRRKFDIRVWAILVHPYSIHMYSEASCRTSSVPYRADQLDDQFAHITNHCLQEGNGGFGEYEEDNEIMFTDLDQHVVLKEEMKADSGPSRTLGDSVVPFSVSSILRPQMAHIIVKTLMCIKEEIEVSEDEPFRCFQLFGYDFIADDDLHVHLLEINGSPGAAQRLLAPLVESMTRIIFSTTSSCEEDSTQPDEGPLLGNTRSNSQPYWIRLQ